tara:strand:- start:4561 stop:5031 length:471 start_codon:yes stop_codon:yes gene_type:complete
MVPMADFDDPAAVRARYDLLSGEGAEPGAYAGVPVFEFEMTGGITGETAEGRFKIPEAAPFFGDHFARRPVFPGTLLMDLNLRFLSSLVDQLPGEGSWKAIGMTDVKLRAFMPPGEELALRAEVEEIVGDRAVIRVQSRRGKRLNSGARVLLSQSK